ncbi:MAG TPA: hypothetical protein VHL34_08680 [Rhizomicrobium sp.]|nr:hypothetical protein [Rhizomicrobium sp.]
MSPNLLGSAPHGALCDALLARGPSPDLSADDNLFGWLVGSWDVEVHDFETDGARRVSNGEWHFAWVLEGRAIQDVFVTPKRGERSFGPMPANRYGTTLRIFDVASSVWRLVWINPVRNDVDMLTTRRDDGDIVQEGVDVNGTRFRWIFSNITDDGFTFCAEEALESTGDWKKLAELTATRTS